ncbi:MAG: AAA family ATPase [bacterium]|nr:AAA family ATPase [bacterium]
MLVVATSAAGTLRKADILGYEKYAKEQGSCLKTYNPGELMFKIAEEQSINITPENILDAPQNELTLLRRVALEQLKPNFDAHNKQGDVAILRTHAMFPWKNVPQSAWSTKAISALNPDMFITFVDEAPLILERLAENKQWAKVNFSLKEILWWMAYEVNMARDWADFLNKPFYVVPAGAPPDFLYQLLFKPEAEMAYVSMPITHGYDEETQSKLDNFIKSLKKHFLVFDPRYVKPMDGSKGEIFNMAISNNIVNRDLNLFLRQSKRLIAYWPKVISSPGMVDEIVKASEANKEVWLVWPEGESISPFLLHYAHKVFTEKEFALHLETNFNKI